MQIIDSLLLNVILIIFPLLLYLFYMIYNIYVDDNNYEGLLDVSLFTSLYLILKLGGFDNDIPKILFNAPLIIAYANKRKVSIIFLSLLISSYYITFLDANFILVIIEYLIYYGVYFYLNKKEFKWNIYIDYFIIIKSLFISILLFSKIGSGNDFEVFINVFALIIILYLTTYFAVDLFNKGKDMIRLHMNVKELEREKQIRTSLFKITHEIKNPIAVCKGYLDMFDVNNLDHSQKYVPIIKDEIDRVLVLLQDFLSISKVKLNCEIMDINMMLEDVINSLKPLLYSKSISLINEIIDDEIYIEGDYNRLSQVIINLVKNSVEASKNNNGYIKIRTKLNEKTYNIIIEDNGSGISEENLKHINELFYTTKSSGTGLGVYLSNEIIKAHNGSISYNSIENEGTKVKIILPYNSELNT